MAYHGFVRDVAVLLKAGLALLLLRGHVVRDVGVVALLCTRDTLQPLWLYRFVPHGDCVHFTFNHR
jgi:hypothetical protein